MHRLILISHTLCIQETAETTVEQLPHTGDAELTTPQEDIADRETTTVSSVCTCLLILMCMPMIKLYFHDCAYSCGSSGSFSKLSFYVNHEIGKIF